MEVMANVWHATRMAAETVWSVLSMLSGGNPGLALAAILVGIAWFFGVGAIIGSFF